MLYKIIVLALVCTTEALKVGASFNRRAALAKAASLAPFVPLAAFAELKKASDADVYARADAGKLTAARVIERAKRGELVDGSSANCEELKSLIAVDKQAIKFEKDKLEALKGAEAEAQKKVVADAEANIAAQVKKLEAKKAEKGCESDFDVYKRADEGKLNSARVIERAKSGQLVSGESASCSELDKIIKIDQEAIAFEKDKLEALEDANDPAAKTQKKIVADAETAIVNQVKKLQAVKEKKLCN